MSSWKSPWSALLGETFGPFALFGKGGKQHIEIGSGPKMALLLLESAKQISNGSAFVHKAAEVALWLAQTHRFREDCQSLRLIFKPLMSQGLQEADFKHVPPALTSSCPLERWL